MSNRPYNWAEYLLTAIRMSFGIPPPSVGPQVLPASFTMVKNPAKTGEAVDDKPKAIPFNGFPGYSERGAPDEWDMSLGEVFGYRWWYMPVDPSLVGYMFPCNASYNEYALSTDKTRGILYGANNQPWMNGRMEARCTSTRRNSSSYDFVMDRPPLIHEPPEIREACGCGFWAYFNKDLQIGSVLAEAMTKDIPNVSSYGASVPVFGVVKGTGRVIIGDKGFRSQYAQIMGLCIPPVTVTQLSWWIHNPTSLSIAKEKCSEIEHLTRLSAIESLLSMAYPSARLFTDQSLLTSYFPPDKNYS